MKRGLWLLFLAACGGAGEAGGAGAAVREGGEGGASFPARAFRMTSRTVSRGPGSTMVIDVSALWVLEQGQSPRERFLSYMVAEGTMTVGYEGDVADCRVSFNESFDLLDVVSDDQLLVDTRDKTYTAFGRGSAEVEAVGSCADGEPLPYSTTAGGVWLMAEDTAYGSLATFSGSYNDGAQLPTNIEWTFVKQE